jgi:hypothetical protein
MNSTSLRQIIKESIQEYIREVETSGNVAAQEAKIRACDEAIELREKKLNMEGLDEAYHDMIDEAKKKNLEKEIKELQKYKKKAEKILEKMKSKAGKEDTMENEGMEEEAVIDEVAIDEMDPEAGPQLEEAKKKKAAKKEKEEKEMMNESFLYMQKLAGLITEDQLRKILTENKNYTPPIYEPINDLMDYIFQSTGVHGQIKPYRAISWLPGVSAEDENMDMLTYKKGKQEIAIGADDVYQDIDSEDFNSWVINSNDPSLDFGEYLTFNEVVDAVSDWLNS